MDLLVEGRRNGGIEYMCITLEICEVNKFKCNTLFTLSFRLFCINVGCMTY